MKALIAVRHGESVGENLSGAGEIQIENLADKLKAKLERADTFYSKKISHPCIPSTSDVRPSLLCRFQKETSG